MGRMHWMHEVNAWDGWKGLVEFRAVAARGIFRWGGKALKNWVWSKIPSGATPKK